MPEELPVSRSCILWGSAGHAKVLAALLALRGDRVVALFDNNLTISPALAGVPLFHGESGFVNWCRERDTTEPVYGWVAIGGSRGLDRMAIQSTLLNAGILIPPLMHPDASVCTSATIGRGTQVLAQSVVAADARVGNACIINHRANVDHECELEDGVHLAPGATLCGCVVVERGAMVGAGAVVLPRLRVGAGAIVGAGAVVTRDVAPGSVVMGNPARSRP